MQGACREEFVQQRIRGDRAGTACRLQCLHGLELAAD
jgi:hypothetical protein